MKPRLLLADDHTLLLEGIRLMLEPEFDLVGSVEDGQALLAAAKTLKPDVILLDISMPRSEWNRRSAPAQEASAFGQIDLSNHARGCRLRGGSISGRRDGISLEASGGLRTAHRHPRSIEGKSLCEPARHTKRPGFADFVFETGRQVLGSPDPAPAGGSATGGRRAKPQGDCGYFEYFREDRGVPQRRSSCES